MERGVGSWLASFIFFPYWGEGMLVEKMAQIGLEAVLRGHRLDQ